MRITLIAAMLSVAFVSTALSLGSAVAAESDRNKVAQKPVGTQTASSRPKASNTPSSAKSKPASPPKKSCCFTVYSTLLCSIALRFITGACGKTSSS